MTFSRYKPFSQLTPKVIQEVKKINFNESYSLLNY